MLPNGITKHDLHDIVNDEIWCHHCYTVRGVGGVVIDPLYKDEFLVIKTDMVFDEGQLNDLVWGDFFFSCDFQFDDDDITLQELFEDDCLAHIADKYNATLSVIDGGGKLVTPYLCTLERRLI